MVLHINAHLSGQRQGELPASWLSENYKVRCRVCGLCVAASRGVHDTCRPQERRALQQSGPSQHESSNLREQPANLPALAEVHSRKTPTYQHVPKQCRGKWAQTLVRCLALVVHTNSAAAWTELEMLPKSVLCSPPRRGKAHAKAAAAFTLDRLARWEAGERLSLWGDLPTTKLGKVDNSMEARHRRAEALAREGLDSKACAALTGEPLVEATRDNHRLLTQLHPEEPPPNCPPLAELALAPRLLPEAVLAALRSFPKGSGCGPAGLRAQHLLDSLTPAYKTTVLELLTEVSQLLADGRGPRELAPFLAGAGLMASRKKDGGVRPIAVGEVLRRLVAKTLSKETQEAAQRYLWPLQVGVACPLGAECAIHTAAQWTQRHRHTPDHVFLKVDFSNAFNHINRDKMLTQVRQHFPELARWCHYCYGRHSILQFGQWQVSSQCGVQQGDPLGPLLFALALQPLAQELASAREDSDLSLLTFYLDDGVMGGSAAAVSSALRTLQAGGASYGLTLNLRKCELIVPSGQLSASARSLFPRPLLHDEETNASRVNLDGDFELLGAPIGSQTYCAKVVTDRATKAKETLAAVAQLPDPQVGLRLLRNCAGYCKMVFAMRTVDPDAIRAPLAAFDRGVRDTFTELTGFSPTEEEWQQAQLGLGKAGLGLRSAEKHAPAAYLASRTSTRELCAQVDPAYSWDAEQPGSALSTAAASLAAALPTNKQALLQNPADLKQKTLSDALDEAGLTQRLAGASASVAAAVLSETLPGAGGFLTAVPCRALGLTFEPAEFNTELHRRLGAKLFGQDDFCPLCDAVMDTHGFHASVCTCGGDKTAGHNAARNEVFHIAAGAGCQPDLETGGLLPPRPDEPTDTGARRPADVFVPNWHGGAPAALDLAITSPQRQAALSLASGEAGAAARLYEQRKRMFLDTEAQCAQQGIAFLPMVAESSGGWGQSGVKVLRKLANKAGARDGTPASLHMSQYLERLSVAIRRAAARAVLRRCQPVADTSGRPAETAATVLSEA